MDQIHTQKILEKLRNDQQQPFTRGLSEEHQTNKVWPALSSETFEDEESAHYPKTQWVRVMSEFRKSPIHFDIMNKRYLKTEIPIFNFNAKDNAGAEQQHKSPQNSDEDPIDFPKCDREDCTHCSCAEYILDQDQLRDYFRNALSKFPDSELERESEEVFDAHFSFDNFVFYQPGSAYRPLSPLEFLPPPTKSQQMIIDRYTKSTRSDGNPSYSAETDEFRGVSPKYSQHNPVVGRYLCGKVLRRYPPEESAERLLCLPMIWQFQKRAIRKRWLKDRVRRLYTIDKIKKKRYLNFADSKKQMPQWLFDYLTN